MRVNGEIFFLINGWMNYLSLLLAARLGRVRLRRGRLSSVLGSGYALAAWGWLPTLRGVPQLMLAALGMAALSFGRHALKMGPLVLACSLLLAGLCDFGWRWGLPAGGVLAVCGAAVLGLIGLLNRGSLPSREACSVEITLRGKTMRLPALRDSGS